MKKLLLDFKGYYTGLIIGPFFKLSEAVMELFVPLIMANIIDKGILKNDTAYILRNGLLLLVIGALGFAFSLICQYSASHVAHGYGKALRARLFKHVFNLTEADRTRLGANGLITNLTNDVNQMQTGINMFIRLAIRAPYLAVGSIVMALIMDFKLGLIFIVTTPLILAVLYIVTKFSVPFYTKIQSKQDIISRLVREMILGARVIRAFSRQGQAQNEFEKAGEELSEITVKVGKLSALLNPLTVIIINAGIIAIIWFGASFANLGAIQPGTILALVNYMTQTLLALIVLSNILIIFSKAVASAKRVEGLLNEQASFNYPVKSEKQNSSSMVKFNSVYFSYIENHPALENISFELKRGEVLGVIGGTGCGKSTVAKLLLRFYNANEGSVLYKNAPVSTYTKQELNKCIAYVPQSANLFTGSIRYNLSIGNENASDDILWQALKTAQAADFVEKLDNGLDFKLIEGGKNLSGGQRQRLCIARALCINFELIILDDAASALDYTTDAALRKALRETLSDKAVVFITQRASSLSFADKILVLDDGEQAGLGTHKELLQTSEIYKEICLSQGVTQGVSV